VSESALSTAKAMAASPSVNNTFGGTRKASEKHRNAQVKASAVSFKSNDAANIRVAPLESTVVKSPSLSLYVLVPCWKPERMRK
jgi:hypothetical protein